MDVSSHWSNRRRGMNHWCFHLSNLQSPTTVTCELNGLFPLLLRRSDWRRQPALSLKVGVTILLFFFLPVLGVNSGSDFLGRFATHFTRVWAHSNFLGRATTHFTRVWVTVTNASLPTLAR